MSNYTLPTIAPPLLYPLLSLIRVRRTGWCAYPVRCSSLQLLKNAGAGLVAVYLLAQSLAIQVNDTENKREVRAAKVRNATCQVMAETNSHALPVTVVQIHTQKHDIKAQTYLFLCLKKLGSGVLCKTITILRQLGTLWIQAGRGGGMYVSHVYMQHQVRQTGQVSWVLSLSLTNPSFLFSFFFVSTFMSFMCLTYHSHLSSTSFAS